MTTKQPIAVIGADQTQIAALPEAIAKRDELLAVARKGQRIASAESAGRATNVLRELKTFSKQIEDARKAVKAPILELGRRIDDLAVEMTADINKESARISLLIGEFTAEQERIARDARAKAEEEARRIREEAEKIEREARAKAEAEARAAAEKAAAETNALAKAQAARVAAEAKLRAEKEAEDRRKATEAKLAAQTIAVAAVTPKQTGAFTRTDVDFEVTDIAALLATNPALVTLEVNRTALKAALKALPDGATLPGVRHWQTSAAVVRTS